MADSKISALTSGGGFQAGDFIPIDRSAANYKVTPIGVPVLVYRYTVTGSDKASIDTGVDTPDAGSNDWTNGDLLEIFLQSRTDEAVLLSSLKLTFNNDGTAVYDSPFFYTTTTAMTAGSGAAGSSLGIDTAGASMAANVAGLAELIVSNYMGAFYKTGLQRVMAQDTSSTNNHFENLVAGFQYRSTSAISRVAVATATGGKKMKIGTQLLIYKRLAS